MTVLDDVAVDGVTHEGHPSRGPRVWLVLGSIAAVLGVGFGGLQVASLLAHHTTDYWQKFSSSGVHVLDVSVGSGDVSVVGRSGGIQVHGIIDEGLFGATHSATVEGERLVIRGSCPVFWSTHCGVHFDIFVPADIHVIVHTDSGTASVSGITGGARVTSDNGNIDAVGVDGDLSMSTDNGDVRARAVSSGNVSVDSDNGDVSLGFFDPPSRLTTHSDNGDLTVTLPSGDAAYALHATTDNGSVSTPIRTDPASDRRIQATSDNGDITIHYAA